MTSLFNLSERYLQTVPLKENYSCQIWTTAQLAVDNGMEPISAMLDYPLGLIWYFDIIVVVV